MAVYRTLAELGAFEADQWRDWLRDGIGQWFSVSLDPLEFSPSDPRADVRRTAFRPFGISPRTVDLPGTLSLAISADLHGAVARAALGVGLLLDEWQVTADGARAAAALISLGANLQTPGLARRIAEMLHRPIMADNAGRRILTGAIVDAIIKRGPRREALEVARVLQSKEWIDAAVAARLLPSLSTGKIEDLARLIVQFCPAMLAADAPKDAVELLAVEMRATKNWQAAPAGSGEQSDGAIARALELVRNLEIRASARRSPGLDRVTKSEAYERADQAGEQVRALLGHMLERSEAKGIFVHEAPRLVQ